MHKPKFYYSPDAPEGGGGTTVIEKEKVEVQPESHEEAKVFDKEKPFSKALETPIKEEKKVDDKRKPEEIEADKVKLATEKTEKIKSLGLKVEATDEEINKADRANKIKTLELKEEATDEEIAEAEEAKLELTEKELTLDDKDDVKLNEEEEGSWKATAKELGFEIVNDTFEEFKTKLDEKIEAVRKEEQDKQYELKLDDHTPEARELIKFLDNKGNLEDFVKPLAVFDEALTLSDETLVEISLKNQKWDDDKIAEHIASLKEDSKLEAAGYTLRKQIENNKAIKSQEIIKSQELKFQVLETERLADEKKENESIKAIIDKSDEFLGGKLSKETKEALYKKHLRGDYRKRLESSPEDAVKTMLFLEFGDKRYKQIEKDMFQKGKEKVAAKLHNTKKIEGSSQQASTATGFKKWDEAVNGSSKAEK